MRIEGKTALVTGAAEGIGKAVSEKLLEKGAKFVAILDFNKELGQQTVKDFAEKFGEGRVRFIHCDVADEKRLKESFQEAYDVHGNLDIVINNAGIGTANPKRVIAVNLVAMVNGCFFAEELMTKEKRQEKGVIINTASMAGLETGVAYLYSHYYASKHGVVGFTKSLPTAADNFSKDLRVVAICPSVVQTSILKSQGVMDDEKKKHLDELLRQYLVDISVVVAGFILAIEDEKLNGSIITTTKEGINVQQ